MEKNIEKSFPADTSLEINTFLNDKKIDGELYSFLLGNSYGNDNGETVIYKKNLPTQKQICEKVGIKSAKTLRVHLDYLIQKGYLIEKETYYILPKKEKIYLQIPLETVQFLNDTLKEQVIKIYIYLGQRYKMKKDEDKGELYVFTISELAQHIGVKLDGNKRAYETINNALDCLSILGLVKFVEFFDGKKPQKKLTKFSIERPQLNG